MRQRPILFVATAFVASLVLLAVHGPTLAQQGHPLVGTWSGYWEADSDQRHRILLLLDYDGQSITGVINPGPNPVPLTRATLDPDTWTVMLEGDRRDADGNVIHYVIEGQIENLTSTTQRAIAGTWTQDDTRGNFRVTLN